MITAPAQVDRDLAPGEAVEVAVTVESRGLAGWASHSQIPVFLSYHLRRPAAPGEAGPMIAFDNARTPLPALLYSGQAQHVALQVTAPIDPGDYVLEVDLVHEGITWFADRGVVPARVGIRVRG